jgi:hypothetical protein
VPIPKFQKLQFTEHFFQLVITIVNQKSKIEAAGGAAVALWFFNKGYCIYEYLGTRVPTSTTMLVVETMVETSPRGLAKARSTPE